MNIARVGGCLTSHYLFDPYSCLQHYKRAFKLLLQLKRGGGKLLVVGRRHQTDIALQRHFPGLAAASAAAAVGPHTRQLLSAAPAHYSALICQDCVAFAPYLYGLNLPVLGVCTPREVHEHPEILKVVDYLIPHTSNRPDTALRKLLETQILEEAADSASGKREDVEGKSHPRIEALGCACAKRAVAHAFVSEDFSRTASQAVLDGGLVSGGSWEMPRTPF
ncbi:uncharacterized protein LOC113147440 [Cyclospora cayetanensis]|uniref:Uncharacterized protein LOC113147440 n=1 Tax=Cyclospora cayetanensis TaxID=88456 RepID=A0A6P6S205_9EIME|nr:uncharacterized protein LOC113147440 [Cyclospora cayetanensis]